MSLTELIAQCEDCLRWLDGDELKGLRWVSLIDSRGRGAGQRIRLRLTALLKAALDVAGEPPVTELEVLRATMRKMPKQLGVTTAIRLVKRLQAWAVALVSQESGTGKPPAQLRGAVCAVKPAVKSEVSLDARRWPSSSYTRTGRRSRSLNTWAAMRRVLRRNGARSSRQRLQPARLPSTPAGGAGRARGTPMATSRPGRRSSNAG